MQSNPHAMIVACVDGSPYTDAVSDYAAWAAGRVEAGLKLLHTIDERPAALADLSGSIGLDSREQLLEDLVSLEEQRSRILREEGKALLADISARLVSAGQPQPVLRQRRGTLQNTLIDCEEDIRILVMGIRGLDHQDRADHLGDQLESVARALYKPILVVNREFTEPRKIMLAFDGSEGSRKALRMITDRPLLKGLPCHLVNVSQSRRSSAHLEDAVARLEQAGVTVTVAELNGPPQEALCNYQQREQIDLTVMGAFSHTRIRDLLIGSFTVKMLLKTRQPLLLLR